MSKNWLLALPILLCLLSCDGFSTGGNPNEGKCSFVLREHPTEMLNRMRVECPYDSSCSIKFHFGPAASSNIFEDCGTYEYKFIHNNESLIVNLNSNVALFLNSDNHVRFSIFDIKDVEKNYDIDLSGIINSYMVWGDSVDVDVMENCSLSLYSCKNDSVYKNSLPNGVYSFSITDGCKNYFGYDCSWHNQGSLKTDDLDIHATIYWKE